MKTKQRIESVGRKTHGHSSLRGGIVFNPLLALVVSFSFAGCDPNGTQGPASDSDSGGADMPDSGSADAGSDSSTDLGLDLNGEMGSDSGSDTGSGQTTITKEDFRINEEAFVTTIGQQQAPDIAASAGGYSVVWLDNRGIEYTIDAQMVDSDGEATGLTLQINDGPSDVSRGLPQVARQFPDNAIGDPIGTSIFVWQDYRDGFPGGAVYAQLYDNTNESLIGANFRIDDSSDEGQSAPSVSMWPTDSRFVVVWTDQRQEGFADENIYARVFAGDGTPTGPSFRVNDDEGIAGQQSPDVGLAPDGGFVVVWKDARSPSMYYEIWAQRFGADGSPRGENFRVDVCPDDAEECLDVNGAVTPRVDVAGDGSFVVTYVGSLGSGESSRRHIRAQRYLSSGEVDGDPVEITDPDVVGMVVGPNVSMLFNQTPKSGYIVTWESTDGSVYAQCVDSSGNLAGEDTLINSPSGSSQGRPSIATLGFGNTNPPNNRSMLVWQDERLGDNDIWAQLVVNQCDLDGTNVLVNGRSEGGTNQSSPSIGATPDGNTVAVWQDDRNPALREDIYGRRMDVNGDFVGPDFPISDDLSDALQLEPDVAVNSDGSFVVVFTDHRDDENGDVFAQRFDDNGDPVGSNFVVNDSATGQQTTPAVAIEPDGRFAIVWVDGRNTLRGDVFLQVFAPDGSPDGANTRVNTDDDGAEHRDPALVFLNTGELAITWSDARDDDLDIWFQRFDVDGNPDGGNQRINSVTADLQILPGIDASPSGDFLIAWVDYSQNEWGDVTAQLFDEQGAIDGNFQVNDVDDVANPFPAEYPYGPSVAATPSTTSTQQDGTFVVAWTDYRNSVDGPDDPDIYAQLYLAGGISSGLNFRVDSAPAETEQVAVDLARDASSPNGLRFCWTDGRDVPNEGQSVWGNILDW